MIKLDKKLEAKMYALTGAERSLTEEEKQRLFEALKPKKRVTDKRDKSLIEEGERSF